MNRTPGWLEALARLFLSAIFLFRAGKTLVRPAEAMQELMDAGLPAVPVLFVIALTFLLLGSLGMVLGYRTRTAAFILLILSVADLLLVSSHWDTGDISILFMRLSIMGGLLMVLLYGAGSWSFDAQSMVPVRRKRS